MACLKRILFLAVLSVSFFVLSTAFSLAATAPCDTSSFCQSSSCSSSVSLTFPPGGGTIANKAFVTLPKGAYIGSASVDMVAQGAIGTTPYIWIPATSQNKLVQLRTSDGSLVRVFNNSMSNCAFTTPSRITVIAGGDVWVGSRTTNSVVRLGLKTGCTGDDCYECKATYFPAGGGTDSRGVTFDSVGNIWIGSYSTGNTLVRLCGHANCKDVNGNTGYSIGQEMQINSAGSKVISGIPVYGLIGDVYGNIWAAGNLGAPNENVYRIDIKDNTATRRDTNAGDVYGIGIDNEGDIWIGRHGSSGAWEIDGADAGGAGTGTIEAANKCVTTNTTTGLAVDGQDNVWVTGYSASPADEIYVIKGGNCANIFTKSINKKTGAAGICTWGYPHGMAIDRDNHAWLVCDTGEVVKFAFHDDGDAVYDDDGEQDIEELLRINICVLAGVGCSNVGADTYNYSDMTGFRTIMSQFNPGSGTDIPVTSTTISGWQAALQTTLATCSCDYDGIPASGDECRLNSDGSCIVPLSFSSTISGTYTLQNLNISCTETIPDMLGGIVPCGRVANNSATPYDETQSCTLCHVFILLQMITTFVVEMGGIIAVFFLVIGGLIYASSAGDQGRAETGKKAIMWAIYGLAIIMLAWLIVTIVLVALGYINPLGGQWNIVSCTVA